MPELTADNLLALVTLTVMEIVLGVDNIVFIAILSGKLPEGRRKQARLIGLGLAMLMRICLLLGIKWIMGLKAVLFQVFGQQYTWKDLILLAGGVFLIGKATWEIHHQINKEYEDVTPGAPKKSVSFASVIVQILLLDLVFSIDSVLTAVGMAQDITIMVIAVVISVLVMLLFSGVISRFIERHATVKMLALSFLILIGVMLVAEGGTDTHVPKGYIYFAMGFSVFVELLQMRFRAKRTMPPPEVVQDQLQG